MILVSLTLCAVAITNDVCTQPQGQPITLTKTDTVEQCEALAAIYADVLAPGENFTITCKEEDETPMPKYKPRKFPLLQAAPVTPDANGYWRHPGIPDLGPLNSDAYYKYSERQRLVFDFVMFTKDAPADLISRYATAEESPLREWQPTKPEGEGWFVWAISPSEQGPVCFWCRRTSADEQRIAAAEAKRLRKAQRHA